MSNFHERVEALLREKQFAHIIPLIYYHGVDCQVSYPKDDVITDVYGSEYSGGSEDYSETIKAIIIPEEYTSQYNGAVMYTMLPKTLPVGTILAVDRQRDLSDRRYSIHNFKRYGLTERVIYRYLMNSIGDQ